MDAEQFVLHGPTLSYEHPTEALGTTLLRNMKEYGDKIVHINALDGSSESFASFRSRSICIAENMRLYGIGKGDNISICSRNQANAFATAIASVLIGAPINGLDVGLATTDMKYILNLIKPKAVFCETEGLPAVKEALSGIDLKTLIVVYDDENTQHVPFSKFVINKGNEDLFKPVEFDNLKEATIFIVCSSGTSGYPKGVMLSHFTLAASYPHFIKEQKATAIMFKIEPKMFVFTSLYWLSGLVGLFISAYAGFTRIFVPKPFTEKLALEIFQNHKPTMVIMPPAMVNRLVKYPDVGNYDLSSINVLTISGSKASPELSAQMHKLLPKGVVLIAYGMTECPSGIAMNTPGTTNFNAIGNLAKGLSAIIIDVDSGKPLARNKVGELWVKCDFLMQGYYNQPEETAKAIDEDGWLHTGDMGYFDEDGVFFITDRLKEVLKYQNWPISPAEVENVLLSHPAAADCCIVGVPHEVYGDLLVAFVLLVKGIEVTEDELKAHVAERVSDAKKLRGGVIFLPELPVLPSGKVNRKLLKANALTMKNEILAKAD